METLVGVLIFIIFILSVAIFIIMEQRDHARASLNKLSDDLFASRIKPYEYTLFYMGKYKRLQQELTDSKVIFRNLWNRYINSVPHFFKGPDEYIEKLKREELIFKEYGDTGNYISINELKTHARDLKSDFLSTIKSI